MKALVITPGKGNVRLTDIPEPEIKSPDDVKMEVIETGICGTDREEAEGGRADAPAGEDTLVIGHEMLGRVVDLGSSVKIVKKGDYALFMVRRPCNHCVPCHSERSDMCFTGEYSERGIMGAHGFQAEYVVDKEIFTIPVPERIREVAVLTEPMSVVVKAINEALTMQAARLPGMNSGNWLRGKRTLVAGLGPIGLLAAFILRLRGAEVFGLDIVKESSPRPQILKEIGGKYINGLEVQTDKIDDKYGRMDFILEATGIAKLEFQLIDALGMNGIYVLTGIPSGERPVTLLGSVLMRKMVLMNQVMMGSVNAGKTHYTEAVNELGKALSEFDSLKKLITERVKYQNFNDAFSINSSDEIKTVIEWKK